MFNEIRMTIQVHPLNLELYQHEEIYARENLNADSRDVDEAHSHMLVESFRIYG